MSPQNQEAMLWGLVKAAVRPKVSLLSFQEFWKKRAEEIKAQPSLFDQASGAGQGSEPDLNSQHPAIAPKQPQGAFETPQTVQSSHPDKTAPLKAEFEVTAPSSVLPDQDPGVRDRYEKWRVRKIQLALDALDIMERGRRRHAARGFLLTQHPDALRFSQMIDEGRFEDLAAETEKQLLSGIEKEINLPDLEAWKVYQ